MVAVEGLCEAFRNVNGLANDEEYAIVVARALVGGVVDSCAYGDVPWRKVLKQ